MAQKFLSRVHLVDGSSSSPGLSFFNDTDTGIWRNTYSGSSMQLNISTEGATRASFNSAGITSYANVYTASGGSFRNYSGVWKGTTGVSGNGFQFINTADNVTAMSLSASGVATFAGNIITTGSSITIDPPSGDAALNLTHSSQSLRIDQNSIRTTTNTNLAFLTNNTLALTLDTSQNATFLGVVKADGNVALGNISGVARLQHEGSGQLKMLSSGDSHIATFTSTGTTFANDITLNGTAPTLRIQDSRNLNNGDWDNVSLGNIEFYSSDTTSPGARVLAEIEAFSNAAAASGPNAELRFKTSENLSTSPQTRLTISHDGDATFTGSVHSGGRVRIQGGTDNGSQLNLFCDSDGDAHLAAYTFTINTGSNSSRTESLKIDNNKNATFAGELIIPEYLKHAGDADTYFGFSANNQVLFHVGGGDRLIINSAGNVGIGTNSPAGLLHVSSGTSGDAVVIIESDTDNNDENDNPQLQFKQDGGNTIAKIGLSGDAGTIFTNSLANTAYFGNDEAASVQLYTNATARLTIESGGDVGIGTTNPQERLHVYKAGASRVETETTTGPAAFKATNNAGSYGWYVPGGSDSFKLYNFSTDVDLLTFSSNGNAVFTGTLETGSTGFFYGNGAAAIKFGNTSTLVTMSYSGTTGIMRAESGSALEFHTNGVNTALTLDTSQNATFASSIITTSNSAVIQTPRLSIEADGTLDWGAARDYGTLTWDTGKAIIQAQSGKALEFLTNGSSLALTLDTSQNATFAGAVEMASGKITSDGSAAAGAYLELKHANNNSTDVCATINLTNNAGGYAAIEGGTSGANNTGYINFKTDNAGTQGSVLQLNGDKSADFFGNVDIYTGTGLATLNIGRNANEKLQIDQTDNETVLTAYNDSDSDGTHNFRLNRVFQGSGANNFKIQKGGTDQFTIDTNANATFAANINVGGTMTMSNSGNIFSDSVFQFLNTGSGAQYGRFRGIQVSTSYGGTLVSQGILFGTDTNLYRDSSNVLKTDDSLIVSGDVTISGDLQVSGETTTTNVVNLDVSDNIIGLNRGSTSNANDSGLIIERGSTGDNAAFLWDETADSFIFGTTTANPAATGNITFTLAPIQASNATFSGDVSLADNKKLQLGESDDLQIYHDATNSIIKNDVGNLTIRNDANDKDIEFACDNGSGGVAVYFYLDGSIVENRFSKATRHSNNIIAKFGDANDLNIYSNGSNSYIENFNNDFIISNTANDKDIRFFCDDGSGGVAEYFYLDGSLASGGALFTRFPDNSNIGFGNNNDLRIYHNGTNSNIENFTGNLQIINNKDDGDIIFRSDNGSGGTAEYYKIDGGSVLNIFYKDVFIGDNVKSLYGNSSDLQIYHDGNDSRIHNSRGDIVIQNEKDDRDIKFRCDDGSGGTTEYFKLDGTNVRTLVSKPINLIDGVPLQLGNSQDLRIYHNGNNSYIQDSGVGSLKILAQDFDLVNAAETALMIRAIDGAQAELYYGGAKKLETTSAGVTVTGNIGVNTTLPVSKLQVVDGDIRVTTSNSFSNLISSRAANPNAGGYNLGGLLFQAYSSMTNYTTGAAIYAYADGAAWTSTSVPSYLSFHTATSGSATTTEKMVIKNNGNVGIGTASPANPLHVKNSDGSGSNTLSAIKLENGLGNAEFGALSNYARVRANGNEVIAASYGASYFYNDNSPTLTLTSNKVGIGNTSPTIKLDVNSAGSDSVARFQSTDLKARILIQDSADISYFGTNNGTTFLGPDDSPGGNNLQITSAGNVGIGTTTPANTLEVKRSTGDSSIRIQAETSTDSTILKFRNSNADADITVDYTTSNRAKMVFTTDNDDGYLPVMSFEDDRSTIMYGKVGIGTTSPTYKLSVSGGIEAGGKVTYSKSYGSLNTTGNAVAGLTAGFNGASAGFEFKCYGGAGKYQRIVYSCYGDGTTWRPKKVIDEGTNDLDVVASADGTTITFTFKATSSTQSYSPRVIVEATGHSINSTYA